MKTTAPPTDLVLSVGPRLRTASRGMSSAERRRFVLDAWAGSFAGRLILSTLAGRVTVRRLAGATWAALRAAGRGVRRAARRVVVTVGTLAAAGALATAAAQTIVPDGRTATTVSPLGAAHQQVTTGTVSGPNAFNSFSRFGVAAGQRVDLIVPGGAQNLINLVRDERSVIDGALNAFKDGRIGGNVFFANPFGMVVGAQGSINVGSLTVTTPTQGWVDRFFGFGGVPDAASLEQLLAGTAPRSAYGLIRVEGRIDAIDGVRLDATNVEVAAGGRVTTGARFAPDAQALAGFVNLNGIRQATNIVEQGGEIRIVADEDVRIAGTVATPGGRGAGGAPVAGGAIGVTAGRDVTLAPGALVSASGAGAASDGGDVRIWAERESRNEAGSRIEADAGTSGRGGFVDLSARERVVLAGGALSAEGAGGGAGGRVLIDPDDVVIAADLLRGAAGYGASPGASVSGTSLTIIADRSITVQDGRTVSTRDVADPSNVASHREGPSTGASGALTLQAPTITVGANARLLTHATGTHAAGDLKLDGQAIEVRSGAILDASAASGAAGAVQLLATSAGSNLMLPISFRSATASITIDGATIRGGTVDAVASSTVSNAWRYDQPDTFAIDVIQQIPGMLLSFAGINPNVSRASGTSTVTLSNAATLEARGAVNLRAETDVTAGILPPSVSVDPTGRTPLGIGALYAEQRSNATVSVGAASTIRAGDLSVVAQNLGGVTGQIAASASSSGGVTVAFGATIADVQANATVAQGASLQVGGHLQVRATNVGDYTNAVESVASNGRASIAFAYSSIDTRANATLGASAPDTNRVTVVATDHRTTNSISAATSVGESRRDAIMGTVGDAAGMLENPVEILSFALNKALDKLNPETQNQQTSFRIGGSVTYADSRQGATASVGPDAQVRASGTDAHILVGARTLAEGVSNVASVEVSSDKTTDGRSSGNTASNGGAIAIGIGRYAQDAAAIVGDRAELIAPQIGVGAGSSMPGNWTGMSLTDWLTGASDVPNFRVWSQVAGTERVGLAGSVGLWDVDPSARAVVGAGARLRMTGTASAGWNASIVVPVEVDGTAGAADFAFDAPVSVDASVDAGVVAVGGKPGLQNSGSQRSMGATVVQTQMRPTAEAIVREDVVIEGVTETAGGGTVGARGWTTTATGAATGVSVSATNTVTLVGAGVAAGASSTENSNQRGLSLQGMVVLNDVEATTIASVDDEARIVARRVTVEAESTPTIHGVAGAIVYTNGQAVGVGVTVNRAHGTTAARIADNDGLVGGNAWRAVRRTTVEDADVTAGYVTVLVPASELVEGRMVRATASAAEESGNPVGDAATVTFTVVGSDPAGTSAQGEVADGRASLEDRADGTVAVRIPIAALGGASAASAGRILTLQLEDVTPRGSAVAAAGRVTTPELEVSARTGGRVEAVSVAGSASSSGDSSSQSGVFSKLKRGWDQLETRAATLFDSAPDKLTGGTGSGGANQGGRSGFQMGLAGAGSAAVNLVELATDAKVDGTTVDQARADGEAGSLRVDAVGTTEVVAGSGAGALTRSGQSSSGTSVGIAGAVAVNVLGNGVTARLEDTTVLDAGTVDVRALRGGDAISVGVGLAAATGGSDSSNPIVGTGSVSVTLSRFDDAGASLDVADAQVVRATITGRAATVDNGVRALAYNETRQGTGAGGLTLNGKTGIGAAVTYTELANVTSAAIVDSTISRVDTVDARALNAMKITAAAAQAGASTRQNSTSISGALTMNEIDNATSASIRGGSIAAAERVTVRAADAQADLDLREAMTGSRTVSRNSDYDFSGAGAFSTPASGSAILGIAGQLTINTNGSNVGFSISQNRIDNAVDARLVGTQVALGGGRLEVQAESASTIGGFAAGAGGGSKFSGGGSAAINQIDASATAAIVGAPGTSITAAEVAVGATDRARIEGGAGQLNVSTGQSALGIAVAFNQIDGGANASVAGATLNAPSGGTSQVTVDALRDGAILSVAASGAVAANGTGGSVAGSVAVNLLGGAASATVDGSVLSAGFATGDGLRVSAESRPSIDALAGAVAGGGQAAAGGAIGYSRITAATAALLEDTWLAGYDSVRVLARLGGATPSESGRIRGAALGVSGSSDFAFTGSFAVNEMQGTTSATLRRTEIDGVTGADGNGDTIERQAALEVSAIDRSSIQGLSGGAALALGGGGAAVGIATSINRIGGSTTATVDGRYAGTGSDRSGAEVDSAVVAARQAQRIETLAVGAGVGTNVGVAASVSVNLLSADVGARVEGGARIAAADDVGVIADADQRITSSSGSIGIGVNAAGVGASVTVNRITGTTRAAIGGTGTVVDARAEGGNGVEVADGTLSNRANLADATNRQRADQSAGATGIGSNLKNFSMLDLAAAQRTERVTGVAVSASSTRSIESIGLTVGGGTYVGIGAVVGTNLVGGTTEARVDGGARVNRDVDQPGAARQQTTVRASEHVHANTIGGSLGAGLVGGGATVDVTIVDSTTRAIVDGAGVGAAGRTTVAANATHDSASLVAGVAAGGVGVTGTATAVRFSGTTEAKLVDATHAGGDLSVEATRDARVHATAGGAAGGGVAAAGAVAVVLDESTTTAASVGSQIDATGAVGIEATGATGATLLSAAGAVSGGLSVAGNVALLLGQSTVQAYVQGGRIGSDARRAGDVTVSATNLLTADANGGSIGIALGGIGGAFGASVVQSRMSTGAWLSGTTIRSSGSVTVESVTDRDAGAGALSGAFGTTAGISGAVAVVLAGANVAGDTADELGRGDTFSTADDAVGGDRINGSNTGTGGPLTASERASINSGSRIGTTGGSTVGQAIVSGRGASTSARVIASDVRAAGDVVVDATERNRLDASVIGAAVGGIAGVGGAVAVTQLSSEVAASIDGASAVRSDAGVVRVDADAGRRTGSGSGPAVSAEARQGSGGLVGLGAAVAIGRAASRVDAYVERGATVRGGQGVTIAAGDATDVDADAVGLTVGAVAVGIVVADAGKTGTTTAEAGRLPDPMPGARSDEIRADAGTLAVTATRGGAVSAAALAGAGGVFSGNGAGASATDAGAAIARTGADAILRTGPGGTVRLSASATPAVSADARGFSGSLIAAVGASAATAQATTQVLAQVGAGTEVAGGTLEVRATLAQAPILPGSPLLFDTAHANAVAGGGAGLVGINATAAIARTTARTEASIGDDARLDLTDATQVVATGDTRTSASASGVTIGGLLAVGANEARAEAGSSDDPGRVVATVARVGARVTGDAGDLTVRADGRDAVNARSTSGAGGAFSGSAAAAYTLVRNRTTAEVAAGDAAATGPDVQLNARSARIDAIHDSAVSGRVSSTNASLVGASGAVAEHEVDAAVAARLADGARLVVAEGTHAGHDLEINAVNQVHKTASADFDAKSASGGVFDGAATVSRTLVALDTDASIGAGAEALLLGGTTQATHGSLVVAARSDVQARDSTNIDSGGVISVALSSSEIEVVRNTVTATVGQNAVVHSNGDVGLSAHSTGSLSAESSSTTYGLAGRADGNASAIMRSDADVLVSSGADVRGTWDVSLLAGRGARSGIGTFSALATSDAYNNTAIPLNGAPSVDTLVQQTNEVTVESGATVRSVRDVVLDTEQGSVTSRGRGTGRDAYREALAAIASEVSNVFGGGDVSFVSTSNSNGAPYVSGVHVDGAIDAGIQNKQRVHFAENASGELVVTRDGTPNVAPDQGVRWTTRDENLVTQIQADIDRYRQLRTQYEGHADLLANIDAEIARLTAERDAFGPSSQRTVPMIVLDDVVAAGGDIRVRAQNFSGSGTLRAPGDAEIRVTSTTPRWLRVNNLTIPEGSGGRVLFNDVEVADAARIGTLNLSRIAPSFGSVTTGANGAPPSIVVRVSSTVTGAQAPTLDMVGEVRTPLGRTLPAGFADVDLSNDTGSIQIRPIRRTDGTLSEARVVASAPRITASRDFTLSFADGFYHVAGDPTATWADRASYYEALYRGQSEQQRIQGGSLGQRTSSEDGTRAGQGSGIVVGNNVSLNARYLNINGVVQAGIPNWSVTLGGDAETRIGQIETVHPILQRAGLAPANGLYQLTGFSGRTPVYVADGTSGYRTVSREADPVGTVATFYNVNTGRIEVRPIAIEGGRIDLTGRIMSTGGGNLRVFDGYGNISIVNELSNELVLSGLDAGRNAEGVIRITDTSRRVTDAARGVADAIPTTVYRRLGGDVSIETWAGSTLLSVATGAASYALPDGQSGAAVTTNVASLQGTRDAGYATTPGQRFGWTAGQRNVIQWERTEYITRGCYGVGGDGCAPDQDVSRFRSGPVIVPESLTEYDRAGFLITGSTDASAFEASYRFQNERSAYRVPLLDYDTSRYGCGAYWCRDGVEVWRAEGRDLYRFSAGASQPIAIGFVGQDSDGAISVTSQGNLALAAGNIVNESGRISLTSRTGAIAGTALGTAGTDTGRSILRSNDVVLSARTGIGSQAMAIVVAPTGGSDATRVDARTRDGDVAVRQAAGALDVVRISSDTGDAYATAQGDLRAASGASGALVAGRNVVLTSANGSIGATASPLDIRVGAVPDGSLASGGLTATAAGDVHLRQTTGDLFVNRVRATGDVSITTVNGRILDANRLEYADDRALDTLRQVWRDLGLLHATAADAQAKRDANEAAYARARRDEYDRYWRFRNLRAQVGTDGAVVQVGGQTQFAWDAFDENAARLDATQRQALASRGWSAAQIDAEEARRVADARALDARFGGGAYQANWTYAPTAAERTQLASGANWTESQLRFGVSYALLGRGSDTTATVEDPNVVGQRITLNAGSSVGRFLPDVVLAAGQAANWTEAQKLALATAERSDITIAGTGAQQTLTVRRRDDVDLRMQSASGEVTVNARGQAFVGSEESLRIREVRVGGDADPSAATGLAAIKVQGALESARTDGEAAVRSGALVLESGSASVGAADRPIDVRIADGGTLAARAADDVFVRQLGGDLRLDSVFAGRTARLTASGGIYDGIADGAPRIDARELRLDALGGGIGTAADRLGVRVGAGGLQATSAAGGAIWLNAWTPLLLGDLLSGGALDVRTVLADDRLTLAGGATLRAAGDLTATAGALALGAGTVTSDAGRVLLRATAGDATVARVEASGSSAADAVTIEATGRIVDGNGAADNVVTGAADGGTRLRGAAGIGDASPVAGGLDPAAPDAIEVASTRVDAASSGGAVHLALRGDRVVTALSAAADGDLRIAAGAIDTRAGGAPTGTAASSRGALSIDATGTVALAGLSAAGDARVVGGATGIGRLVAGRDASIEAGGPSAIGRVEAGRDLTATVRGDASIDSAFAGRDLRGTVSGDLASRGDGLEAGRTLELDVGGSLDATRLKAPTVIVRARSATLGVLQASTSVDLAVDRLAARVENTGGAPLAASVTSREGGLAERVSLTWASPPGVLVSRFWATEATNVAESGDFSIADARIGLRGTFTSPLTRLLVDASGRRVPDPSFDVQIVPAGPMRLSISGTTVDSDAAVLKRASTHTTIGPWGVNRDAMTESEQLLAAAARAASESRRPPVVPAEGGTPSPLDASGWAPPGLQATRMTVGDDGRVILEQGPSR